VGCIYCGEASGDSGRSDFGRSGFPPARLIVVRGNLGLSPRKGLTERPGVGTMIVSMTDSPSERAIREALAKLLKSPIFAKSRRLGRFLQFTVDHVLAGKQNELKEYVIGVEVYDRRFPYDPAIDSIVRSEARRLRGKLQQYYESDGKSDTVRIIFRAGSYAPEILFQEIPGTGLNGAAEISEHLANTSAEVVISVGRFVDLSGTPPATTCVGGVTGELLHLLMEMKDCGVVAPAVGTFRSGHSHLHLEGDIRQHDGRLRIHCRLTSAEGFQLASHRFDLSTEAAGSFVVQEQIAGALVSRVTSLIRSTTAEFRSPLLPRGRVLSMVIPEKQTTDALP
jgi:TolB-like protein